MAFLVAALVLLAGTACYADQARIIGGSETSVESYPSIVQIEFNGVWTGTWSQYCAGSVLNSQFILSAARCFSGTAYSPANRRVRAGTSTRGDGGYTSGIVSALNHHSYQQRYDEADISVVRLATPFVYSAVIQQAFIISANIALPDNLAVRVIGWGATTQGGAFSSTLQEANVVTVNNALCAQRYGSLSRPRPITENQICAGILNYGGADACFGDAGGPLYYDNLVVGIVSWGHGCGNETYPGVYTAVSPYTTWIVNSAV